MRVIPLTAHKNGNGRPDMPLHDQDLLVECAYAAPQGANFAQVDEACKLADKIRADRKQLQLEDADWNALCGKFRQMTWNLATIDPNIIRELGKTLLEAPAVSVQPVKPVRPAKGKNAVGHVTNNTGIVAQGQQGDNAKTPTTA